MSLLITSIKSLLGIENEPVPFVSGQDMSRVNSLDDAWLLMHDGKILDFGPMKEAASTAVSGDRPRSSNSGNRW